MKRSVFLILISLCLRLAGTAADIVTVSGESTYYDDGTKSKVECMRIAAEQARVDALAREFGTIVSQDIMQADRISGSRERNEFLALSSTEVKGEWIADIGEPEYTFARDKEDNLIVTCRVRGKAKQISNESVACEALVLRNATNRSNADTRFRDGDDMYLYFTGAADGFVAVFLEDESGEVYLLLPYPRDTKSRVPVRKDKEYIFFSRENRGDQFGAEIEEITLTAADRPEYNRIYVVYSTEYFSRPVMAMNGAGLPAMKAQDFTKWLVKARRNDPKMTVKAINIEISPKNY